jgi:hypothetical protein
LKNGDFSAYQGWSRPAGWHLATEAGQHTFTLDPVPRKPLQAPAAMVIRTTASGQGYVFQAVDLLPGTWRLTADVTGAAGAKAMLEVFGPVSKLTDPVAISDQWQTLRLDLPPVAGEIRIHLRFQTSAGEEVRFRRVCLDAVRLEGETVPMTDGTAIGRIVLAKDASPAEEYAAYELQRFCRRMTGRMPGIAGRDATGEGRAIRIGVAAGAAVLAQLDGLDDEAYLLHTNDDALTLVGNSGIGTLYAVYDFLERQGCYWVLPGEVGEVIPERIALAPVADRVETPDYTLARTVGPSFLQLFNPGGGPEMGWIYMDMDEQLDWVVRNRFNAFWNGGPTYDLGAHRGHGWIQNSGHSFNAVIAPYYKYFETHPEWYPLVNGKRMPVSDIGPRLPNQLCVSNQSLRDYTVDLAIQFFKDNPRSQVFPMNPMDGPNYNCECDDCRALDPPGHEWNQDFSDFPRFPNLRLPPMADRYLNYINYVAERMAKVHPEKLLELYTYANRVPPAREKVHPNVTVKYCYHSGRAPSVSLMDPTDALAAKERNWLVGWSKAAPVNLTYYPYTDWETPDAALYWYDNITDLLGNLSREYGCVGMMGETHTTVTADPMWWAIFGRTMWDVDTDPRAVIRELCPAFYGPAADAMTAFYLAMGDAVRDSAVTRETHPQYHPNAHIEISLDKLEVGRDLLDRAAARVVDNPLPARRVDLARLAHACTTYVGALNMPRKTATGGAIARRAFDTANTLRSRHSFLVKIGTARRLKTFHYPAIVDETAVIQELPVIWKFRTDPDEAGIKAQWYRARPDIAWQNIKTTESWTSQGVDYHGAAWYHTPVQLPAEAAGKKLILYFGAVDGYVDVYLDGDKIGEQKVDVGVMWDQPFTVPLPDDLDPAQPHQLMVRVQKDNFAAGIWKPVKILEDGPQ